MTASEDGAVWGVSTGTGVGVGVTTGFTVSWLGTAGVSNGSESELHPHFSLHKFSSSAPSHPSMQTLLHEHAQVL